MSPDSTQALCAALAATHQDQGDEWSAAHIRGMNPAEQIRLARTIRASQGTRHE